VGSGKNINNVVENNSQTQIILGKNASFSFEKTQNNNQQHKCEQLL